MLSTVDPYIYNKKILNFVICYCSLTNENQHLKPCEQLLHDHTESEPSLNDLAILAANSSPSSSHAQQHLPDSLAYNDEQHSCSCRLESTSTSFLLASLEINKINV